MSLQVLVPDTKRKNRCLADYADYFLTPQGGAEYVATYFDVVTQHGVQPLRPWPWQLRAAYFELPRVETVKSRDVGSTLWELALKVRRVTIGTGTLLIAADKADNSQNALDAAREMVYCTPEVFRRPLLKDNTQEIVFADRRTGRPLNKIRALCAGEHVGRSERCLYLHCTETAFWPWARKTWAAVNGALVAGGWRVNESTPNGRGGLYAENYHAALAGARKVYQDERTGEELWVGKDGETAISRRPWRCNPTHDRRWEKRKREDLRTDDAFAQEAECDFLRSGRPVFGRTYTLRVADGTVVIGEEEAPAGLLAPARLRAMSSAQGWEESMAVLDPWDGLELYELPQEGVEYCHGLDVAEGKEDGDYSTGQVIRRDTGRQVAELWGHWPVDLFAERAHVLRCLYPGRVGLEINNHGHAVYLRMTQLGKAPGRWVTDGKSKPLMIDSLDVALKTGGITVCSMGTLDELEVYQVKGDGTKTGAMEGYHDDRVMGLAIANQMRVRVEAGFY